MRGGAGFPRLLPYQIGSNDQYSGTFPGPASPGAYAYTYRFGISDGGPPTIWTYADLTGTTDGFQLNQLGHLDVF